MQPHGEVKVLSSRVRRIVPPDPDPMTGPGTNTYVIGEADLAVLDPGPAIAEHVDAILECVGDRLRYVVCTHTHPDHSPAAAVLAASPGASLVGRTTEDDRHQDLPVQPQTPIEDEHRTAGDGR